MRIVIAKEAFNRKMSLLTNTLNIELKKKLVSSETWALRKLEQKYLKIFQMWYWRRMKTIKWPEKVSYEKVLESIGEKRTFLK